MTDPTRTAEALARYAHVEGKPVLASWMGGERVADGVDILNRAGIPTFAFPDDAARAFCDMGRFADNLRALYETPMPRTGADGHPAERRRDHRPGMRRGQDAARRGGSQGRARQLRHPGRADARGRETRMRRSRRRARLGFPVAVKLWSRVITHKTDVGGVKLGLADEAAVARAFDDIQRFGRREGRGGLLPRRDGAADGRSQRGPRADPGQHASIGSWDRC